MSPCGQSNQNWFTRSPAAARSIAHQWLCKVPREIKLFRRLFVEKENHVLKHVAAKGPQLFDLVGVQVYWALYTDIHFHAIQGNLWHTHRWNAARPGHVTPDCRSCYKSESTKLAPATTLKFCCKWLEHLFHRQCLPLLWCRIPTKLTVRRLLNEVLTWK